MLNKATTDGSSGGQHGRPSRMHAGLASSVQINTLSGRVVMKRGLVASGT